VSLGETPPATAFNARWEGLNDETV